MQVTVDDGEDVEIPKGTNKIIVRDATEGKSAETAVADPHQMAQATKIVDPSNPKVQQGLKQGSLQFVGTVN